MFKLTFGSIHIELYPNQLSRRRATLEMSLLAQSLQYMVSGLHLSIHQDKLRSDMYHRKMLSDKPDCIVHWGQAQNRYVSQKNAF